MTDAELLASVVEAIRSANESAREVEIRPQTRLIEDLSLDSLDLVAVLMRLQDAHRVEFDLDAVPEIRTVSGLMAEFGRLCRARSAA